MKCVNCGASYPDLEEQCPYCGSENIRQAERSHKDKMEGYAFKSSILRALPDIIGRLAGKLVVRVLVIFILGGILLALASAGIARVKSAAAYGNKESVLDSLEVMYQAEDYGAMLELLKKQEHYTSATYGRYYRVGELYELYQSVQPDIDEQLQMAAKYNTPEFLEYTIKPLFKILCYSRDYEEAGYVYDEKEEVEEFRRKAAELLRECCYLSEDEIEQGCLLYENSEDMSGIYELIVNAYCEKHAEG